MPSPKIDFEQRVRARYASGMNKDVFCVGCKTAQRFWDLVDVRPVERHRLGEAVTITVSCQWCGFTASAVEVDHPIPPPT